MRSVGVIGLGLIGGSMAKAVKERCHLPVYGEDAAPSVVMSAINDGTLDGKLEEHFGEIDLLIVALYPDIVADVIESAAGKLKKGCMIVDCTGIKTAVCSRLSKPVKEMGLYFIGGHPMAGKEVSGYGNSDACLYEGASMILCRDENTDEAALDKARDFFLRLGFSQVKITTPEEHDRVIAFTSQLAHIVSSAYVKSSTLPERYGFSAGSFKDLTRVAKLNEEMWADLFLANDGPILSEVRQIIDHLSQYEDALEKKDRDRLVSLLREGREKKEEDMAKEAACSVACITAISSKSYVHRLLIASSLSQHPVKIITNIFSKDMEATVRVICALGANITTTRTSDGRYELDIVRPLKPYDENVKECVLDCIESGSTARFILPLAALVSEKATLTGCGKLPARPMGELADALRNAGVSVSADNLPMTVSGKPCAGRFVIPGNVSSQFISGLLFALPLLEGDSFIEIKGTLESAAYVDMTIDVLKKFGVNVTKTDDGIKVCGGQCYDMGEKGAGPYVIKAEGDWSNAAYIMALGAFGSGRTFSSLKISGLAPDSIQGDRAIADILKNFGTDVSVSQSPEDATFEIKGRPKNPVDIECSQIPDLVPVLCAMAAFVDGDSIFRNVGRLRMKECDRVEAIKDMLGAAGVSVNITSDAGVETITVHGRGHSSVSDGSKEIVIDSHNDHRIAMSAAVIAFASSVPVTIKDSAAVNKSYPGFFDMVKKLGGGICHLN